MTGRAVAQAEIMRAARRYSCSRTMALRYAIVGRNAFRHSGKLITAAPNRWLFVQEEERLRAHEYLSGKKHLEKQFPVGRALALDRFLQIGGPCFTIWTQADFPILSTSKCQDVLEGAFRHIQEPLTAVSRLHTRQTNFPKKLEGRLK